MRGSRDDTSGGGLSRSDTRRRLASIRHAPVTTSLAASKHTRTHAQTNEAVAETAAVRRVERASWDVRENANYASSFRNNQARLETLPQRRSDAVFHSQHQQEQDSARHGVAQQGLRLPAAVSERFISPTQQPPSGMQHRHNQTGARSNSSSRQRRRGGGGTGAAAAAAVATVVNSDDDDDDDDDDNDDSDGYDDAQLGPRDPLPPAPPPPPKLPTPADDALGAPAQFFPAGMEQGSGLLAGTSLPPAPAPPLPPPESMSMAHFDRAGWRETRFAALQKQQSGSSGQEPADSVYENPRKYIPRVISRSSAEEHTSEEGNDDSNMDVPASKRTAQAGHAFHQHHQHQRRQPSKVGEMHVYEQDPSLPLHAVPFHHAGMHGRQQQAATTAAHTTNTHPHQDYSRGHFEVERAVSPAPSAASHNDDATPGAGVGGEQRYSATNLPSGRSEMSPTATFRWDSVVTEFRTATGPTQGHSVA